MSYIEFKALGVSDSGKTKVWNVLNKAGGYPLGKIFWYGPWRQYCFEPKLGSVFSHDCLRDIADFCEAATKEHKKVGAS